VTMAPAVYFRNVDGTRTGLLSSAGMRPGAHETQAAWRHGHFGLKSAPQHRDFRPGKVGDNK